MLYREREFAPPGACSIFGIDDLALAAGGSGLLSSIGGAINNNSATIAAKDAAEVAAQNNNALASSNYAKGLALETPYIASGVNANNAINALLGLPSTGATPQGVLGQANPDYSAYVRNNPDLFKQYQDQTGIARGRTMDQYGQIMWSGYDNTGRTYTPFGSSPSGYNPSNPSGASSSSPSGSDATAANQAFQSYENSTGHQFRLQTGSNALQTSAAARGLLKSGSTLKALDQYGQNLGTQDFQGYLGNLAGQQQLGVNGSSTLANIGGNTVNLMSGNNDSQASAQANAALAGAANTNQLINSANSVFANALGRSSYGGSAGQGGMNAPTYQI